MNLLYIPHFFSFLYLSKENFSSANVLYLQYSFQSLRMNSVNLTPEDFPNLPNFYIFKYLNI